MTSGEGGCVAPAVVKLETIECSDGAGRVAASDADLAAMVSLTVERYSVSCASAILIPMRSDSSVTVDGASGVFGELAEDWMSSCAGGFAGGSVTFCV